MFTCQRCGKEFTPEDIRCNQLCEVCITEIINEKRQVCPDDKTDSDAILFGVQECLAKESPVQKLLDQSGVCLALARLVSVTSDDLTMLAMNAFRIGAWMAFNQVELQKLLNK